jgi:hypothetical protein
MIHEMAARAATGATPHAMVEADVAWGRQMTHPGPTFNAALQAGAIAIKLHIGLSRRLAVVARSSIGKS